MRKIATIIAGVTTVFGCVLEGAPSTYSQPAAEIGPGGVPYNLTSRQLQMVRSETAKTLKDPESAQFGYISARKDSEGSITVCGYVTASSFKGYNAAFVGKIPPTPNNLRFRVIKLGASQTDRTDIKKACRQSGIDIIGRG